MIHVEQVVIVEGKYDRIKLSSILDALIIQTDGFAIFKDKKKLALIRKFAEKNGILILTDSDSAGFKIRNYLNSSIPNEWITHVYIPDILGKEKRKQTPSKEGKLGVEGVPQDVILQALRRAGIDAAHAEQEDEPQITTYDLYEDGITGGKDSKHLRKHLFRALSLPERISTHSLLKILNMTMSREEYKTLVRSLKCE